MKKSVILIVLSVISAALICVTISMSLSYKEKTRQIDSVFVGQYNSLIFEARNGNISNDLQSPNRYDIETAKFSNVLNSIYQYTSYNDNNALLILISLLDDSVGSHRFYPDFSFADMSQETFDILTDLSLHFDDEDLTLEAVEAFKAKLGAN